MSVNEPLTARVFNIQRFSVHDGPGIRTTVFLKGCPLNCRWCCNPESIHPQPQVGHARNTCTRCGRCINACPNGAISLDEEGFPVIDRSLCQSCGACAKACLTDSMTLYGKHMTLDEVYKEVMKDHLFYGSDGGVTVSGGEVLMQVPFVVELFKKCHDAGITTCIETSGCAKEDVFLALLPHLNHVFFDLKHMNPDIHKELVGVDNHLILNNAQTLVANQEKYGYSILFRMPLMPNCNSDEENIRATARFLKKIQGDKARIELMPYHALGKGKYEAIGVEYGMADIPTPSPEFIASVQKMYEEEGVECLAN